MNEDDIYQKIYDELSIDRLVGSTWAKAYELANGNEEIARAKYIALRYESIKKEVDNSKLTYEKSQADLARLNKVRHLAAKDDALNSLSSLRYWYDNTYTGDEALSDSELEKIIELSRSSEVKRPIVPEKYKNNSWKASSTSSEGASSSYNKCQTKIDDNSKVSYQNSSDPVKEKGKMNIINLIIAFILGSLAAKLFGVLGLIVSIACYFLLESKTNKLVAIIASVLAGFLASFLMAVLLF